MPINQTTPGMPCLDKKAKSGQERQDRGRGKFWWIGHSRKQPEAIAGAFLAKQSTTQCWQSLNQYSKKMVRHFLEEFCPAIFTQKTYKDSGETFYRKNPKYFSAEKS